MQAFNDATTRELPNYTPMHKLGSYRGKHVLQEEKDYLNKAEARKCSFNT
jgi:hypothetical protein